MSIDWQPIGLSLALATVTTALLFLLAVPLAWWLANLRWRGKPLIEAVLGLPLVLPPSVLGFYLLLAFSPRQGFGAWLADTLGLRLVFSFEGLVVASVIAGLPFMLRPVQAGFEALPASLAEAAYTLGKSRLRTLVSVLLPNLRPALLAGTVLSFAHTLGEFGVVLMIGGNIPGVTRVASIALYNEVEALNYPLAHVYAGVLVAISFTVLLIVHLSQRHSSSRARGC